ncbi:YrpD family protein [Dehalobacterium formicoaceticum]|uniref:YrpD family protein n=1 Tax=Dehalobacterium formicoaceticum TaxID=51515 RepID=UPI000B7CF9F9|nr:YrpD family protein [Dehalobacterium formicoaceticum]
MKNFRFNIVKILASVFMFSNLITPVAMADVQSKGEFIELESLEQFNPAIHADINLPKEVNQAPDLILKTNQGQVPVYLSDELKTTQDIESYDFRVFLQEALKNQPADSKEKFNSLNNASEEYEFVCVEDEQTLAFYNNSAGQVMMEVTSTDRSIDVHAEQPAIIPLATNVNLPDGYGARARTYSSSADYITAALRSGAPNYNGSVPDNGEEDPESINFYNYLGFTVGTLETDLGLLWSNTYQGWKMYGKVVDGSTKYWHYFPTATTTNPNLVYKSTDGYPTTLRVDKYYNYNGNNRLKMELSGTQTNMNSGTSILIMPRGTTSNVKYKLLTTIASKSESNIKTGASISSNYRNIKLGTSNIGSFEALETDNATLTYNGSILSANVKKE